MNIQVLAVMIQEGSRFISELIKSKPLKRLPPSEESIPATVAIIETEKVVEEGKASSIEAGCVPCSIGHLGTCVGVTNEAMRFAKKDGLESQEVIDRVNMCLDELNALERVDLRPEMIVALPDWEKALANEALSVSRETRHSLEKLSSVDELEIATAKLQTARKDIGREWFKERLARMPKKEKEELAKKARGNLEE